MGLDISVGVLCDAGGGAYAEDSAQDSARQREAFALLSRALADENVTWREPAVPAPQCADDGHYAGGFPYSYLSRLRRVFVLTALGMPVTPAPEHGSRQYVADESLVNDETSMLASHLLCHQDDGGYYVPADFDDPIFLPPGVAAELGAVVGSSHQLLAELQTVAHVLGADAAQAEGVPLFEAERYAWQQLCLAAQASISTGHALTFR
jgi:hypothetical protein